MSALRTITDEDSILRISGTFGSSKTVSINNFGGITYIHLKCPKKNGTANQLATIDENFDIQQEPETGRRGLEGNEGYRRNGTWRNHQSQSWVNCEVGEHNDKKNEGCGGRNPDNRRQRRGCLRVIILKQQCITNICKILCMTPVSLLTRDVLMKLPSSLLMELYQNFDSDLSNNTVDVVFMLYEILTQRTFEVPNASLYQICCSSIVRKCGFLTSEEISFLVRKMDSSVLNDLSNIFLHEHWCRIISNILAARNI
ncbi:unnamed protein product [Mytilus coruscus]|uniref:Uncharacterized protein n=1 Tax=Mytilus coruscus TaxID=42192 RepID=A0A6J8B4H9_MYTCO|nr:unnamed protein product [Mytilus coruscus]